MLFSGVNRYILELFILKLIVQLNASLWKIYIIIEVDRCFFFKQTNSKQSNKKDIKILMLFNLNFFLVQPPFSPNNRRILQQQQQIVLQIQQMSFCQTHPQNQVDFICMQQHKCQRKLCKDCLSEHIENMKQAVTIEKFQKIVNEKLSACQSDNNEDLKQQKKMFQSLLQDIEVQIQKILEELYISITKIYDKIEQEDQSYNQLINENNNLTKSSNESFNKLISIVQEKSLENWNSEKTNYYQYLQKAKQQLNQEAETFGTKIQQWLKEVFKMVGIKNNEFIYTQFQVKFTEEKEVQYLNDGEILRIDQIKDTTRIPEILKNLEQVKHLQWSGQLNFNNQKEGNKKGSWKELIGNYQIQILQQQEVNFYEVGDYDNGIRVKNWKYIYDNKEIGSGDYNENGERNGKWQEPWERFWQHSQLQYIGQYKNGKKVGKWDIQSKENKDTKPLKFLHNSHFSGGGLYDAEGNGLKQGNWIELSEGFFKESQVTYNGQYKNGKKVGGWDICKIEKGVLFGLKFKKIGGGVYDGYNGMKQGNWVEIFDGFYKDSQVTYSGQYKNGKKVCRWDIFFNENEDKRLNLKMQNYIVALITFVFSGGGEYDDGIKQGDWIEISDGFFKDSQITYRGQYKNGKKVARWDIWYKESWDNGKYLKIGGGVYDEGGNEFKQGHWIDLSNGFFRDSQIIYEGQYLNGKKIDRWDICNIQKSILNDTIKSQKIGGGLYEAINQTRTGNWITLSNEFSNTNQIIYHGEYKSGIKVGKWEVLKMNQKDEFELKNFLMFDQKGIELFTKNYSKILLSGKLNQGKKFGRWNIIYDNVIIGGGQYGQQGQENGMKYGKWVEISDEFSYTLQVTYDGEYQNGKKVGRWDIYQFNEKQFKWWQIYYKLILCSGFIIYDFQGNQIKQERNKADIYYVGNFKNGKKVGCWEVWFKKSYGDDKIELIGQGYYDDRGDELKFGNWVEIADGFCDRLQITWKGQYKNGRKISSWEIYYNEFDGEWKHKIIGGGFYDQEGSKSGKWIEQSEIFIWDSQVTYQGHYKNRKKIGMWEIYYKQNDKLKQKLRMQKYSVIQKCFCCCLVVVGFMIKKEVNRENGLNRVRILSGTLKKGKKIGEWGIFYRKQYENEYKQIGGGLYDEKFNGTKSGKWNEQSPSYKWDSEVVYQGNYRNGKKIGDWDTLYRKYNEDKFRKIGGGSYDNGMGGDEVKLGKWVEISDEFKYVSQITQSGEYENGKKIGLWSEKELESDEIIQEFKFEN
ncbi:unnamed protein product [Paramecium octaurelia]|uniref:Uncharacterized protein n=1 Tax=Paramecium octaurelia TaxID=43137 RepID=A0A8S1X6P9_PAROT|nr:unnamed protein product [Paramecium octaurelia]